MESDCLWVALSSGSMEKDLMVDLRWEDELDILVFFSTFSFVCSTHHLLTYYIISFFMMFVSHLEI